jgi:hypothetical protein
MLDKGSKLLNSRRRGRTDDDSLCDGAAHGAQQDGRVAFLLQARLAVRRVAPQAVLRGDLDLAREGAGAPAVGRIVGWEVVWAF